jgi:uncharacterized repeat protein (TIGR01451 family)
MTDRGADSRLFEELARELLSRRFSVRFQARGASMSPAIRDREFVQVTPVIVSKLRKDDIVLTKSNYGFRIHRLVIADHEADRFVTRGDCGLEDDPALSGDQILGIAQAKEVRIGRRIVQAKFKGIGGHVLRGAARGQSIVGKVLRHAASAFPRAKEASFYSRFFLLLFVLLAAAGLCAQVAVDTTTTGTGTLAGTGTVTLTFNHATTTTANRVLIVGVSLNITNNAATVVSGVTWNGTALTQIGAHNDTSGTRRVEMWYLLAPATGTHPVVVSVNIPSRVNIGVVAGATTFTGVDQTAPLGTFVSSDGTAANCVAVATPVSKCNSQLDVPSVVNGMIIDTLATGGNRTISVPSPQVTQWNTDSTGTTNPGVDGVGTTRTGAPSVPIAELMTDGTSNWAEGAISINPTTADVSVTTSTSSAVFLGQNTSYTITVKNNGPSAANSVVLTDTWSTTNFSTVSITPSAGTTCSAAPPPITCNLPTSLASGATATVTIVNTASASGAYTNTASVVDSNTPPDPNSGNNSYTAVATVQSVSCATTTQAVPGGTITGTVNTYYPGTASVAAGGKSITVGAASGAGTGIAIGNLLLIIQMQDAGIKVSNTVTYGNGSTGAGFNALNSAGDYEFVTATSAVTTAGGTLTVSGAGTGGGVVFPYNSAAASGTKGASTFQVILIPQYTTATLAATGLTAPAWNGSTGGVLALDASSTLNLNGATVSMDGLGFRGGAGLQLNGGVTGGTNTDFLFTAPTAYTTPPVNGLDAAKGEGVAGTPRWVESNGAVLGTGVEGYPSGSMARGAPGNAGGGGTDGDATGNTENSGGGGGGNGGSGGFGGNSWSVNLSDGGEGGAAFPSTINRVAMGGGGGAGTRNNSDGDTQASSGAAGGGIIIIRANALTGTATLTANGAAAYNGTSNDAGGGGGAGGSIVVLSANGGESGLTLQANGGRGGDAWDSDTYNFADRHGPGGGGGGGVVLVSGTPASISVTGGTSGTTLNPGVTYGATVGAAGTSVTNATIASTSGTQSGAQCTPDMTLGKSHVGNFVRGSTASYTVPVSNLSLYGATSGVVTINDTLPFGLTPTGGSGSGWSCGVSGQTLSCVRGDSLGAQSSYPSITINATVSQSAPATVTNTALVGGGGEINLANDSATDVASVVSSASLSVTNVASPDPVAAGGNITYTQVLTNTGPSAADNATFIAAIPPNTSFVSFAIPAGWNCVGPGVGATSGNVVCTNANMAGSTSANFGLVVRVNTGTANGTVINETASASSSASDPTSTNNSATATTVVGTTAGGELTVTNSASPNPVIAGNNITYTQVVTNTGTAAATTATFTEVTPPNTTFVSITPPAGWTCTGFPTTPCTDASVAAGSSGTFSVVYKVTAGTANGTTITDTATVNAANQAFGANSAIATDVVGGATQADLALSTVATPSTVLAGNNITYTQAITNNGPAAATTASFSEATPTNTTFQSVSPPVGWTCTTPAVGATGTITCTNPSVAASSTADIVVVLGVPATVAAGTITATSSVTSATSDPNSANNSTTVATGVNTACDLTVTNAGTPSPITAGSNITYTQTVTNHGPSTCTGATFTEPFPANTTFVSLSPVPSGWTCTTTTSISCTNPSFAPGATSTFPVVLKVAAGTASGTIITDTDTGGSATRDTNSTDNSATVSIAVTGATQADLSVTNSASPNPVSGGSNITYTQVVTNSGPASATTVSFTDPLPANTTLVSLTGSAGWTCTTTGTPTCTIATLSSGATGTFTYVVKVNTTVASGTTITQTATVGSATSDPISANNSAAASVTVADSAGLSITNTNSPIPVQAGGNITYTQIVTNAGPSAATSVTLSENTPANTSYQSITAPAGWICIHPAVGAAGAIICTDPSLAPGAATISLVVQVNAATAAGTIISDTATVGSSTTDPNSTNNSATATDIVASATQADLITTNVATPTTVTAGNTVTYTQTVTNNGPAAATTVTFTESTPPNTTFQSITQPAGWTCGTLPAVGGTGTITCTATTLALNASASFSLVLQTATGTPAGTNISDTVTASASNLVTNANSNSSTATVTIGNSSSADMAIVKTASPNPVLEGDILTYTLAVTNNGPASATTVIVTDTLPSVMTYLASTTTTGTCSEAGGSVTCQLGTIANAGTATITITVVAGTPGVVSNTATVTADQIDPTPANNSSTQTETIVAPTSIMLTAFSARIVTDKTGAAHTMLSWKSGGETHNLGFNIYREQNGSQVRINSSLIAGSALLMSGALPKHSAKGYSWIDSTIDSATDSTIAASGTYWLEDVDVNGTRTMHGPVSMQTATATTPENDSPSIQSKTFSDLTSAKSTVASAQQSHAVEAAAPNAPTVNQMQTQFAIAANPAIKIQVKHEGWYRVTQPELVKAGLDPNADPETLHLYAEAVEQPAQITGAIGGPGGFGQQAAINFYGTGIDTLYSGTRVYWLVAGNTAGPRMRQLPPAAGSNLPAANFRSTVELRQRTTYFSALRTVDGDNFFGAMVSSSPLDQVLAVPHFDTTSSEPAKIDLVLQGVIVGFPHDVTVALNGATLGSLDYTGQKKGRFTTTIPPGLLQSGNNTVTLTSQNGTYDISLVDYIRIEYPHSYVADSDQLKFTGRAGDEIEVTGFTKTPSELIDITDPSQPVLLTPQVTSQNGTFELVAQIPWTTTATTASGSPVRHTLLAVAADRVAAAASLQSNHPSQWHSAQSGADIVMITHDEFAGLLAPLVRSHLAQRKSSLVVPVSQLYDEFNFGERSPYALRMFLQSATQNWKTSPKYLLLNGRASFDPRNYLGFGLLDLVPTKIVPTSSLMTASDDWFSDFSNQGMPTIATGRLPVTVATEAKSVVAKLADYESKSTSGPWTSQALMVADVNDTENFSQDSQSVQAQLPSTLQATDIFTGTVGAATARQQIVSAINSGQLLVNYLGHGSEGQWSGSNLFDNTSAMSLTNGSQLPVFLIMDCLNGFFQDVYDQPLGVTLLIAPNGGAVAVVASSGLNQAPPQTKLDKLIVQGILNPPQIAIGDAVMQAKSQIGDASVRKTYVLLGDPAMQVKSSSANSAQH